MQVGGLKYSNDDSLRYRVLAMIHQTSNSPDKVVKLKWADHSLGYIEYGPHWMRVAPSATGSVLVRADASVITAADPLRRMPPVPLREKSTFSINCTARILMRRQREY